MDNFHSVFHFQQDDDNGQHQLLHLPTNTNSSFLYYQHAVQLQDLLPLDVEANKVDLNNTNKTKNITAASLQVNENTISDGKQKKVIHREIERQRRHQMSNLYDSLRQLLPLEYIKGKRSTSDHILGAVNYIENQQKKVRNLEDKLKKALSPKIGCSTLSSESSRTIVTLRPCLDGIEILINWSLTNGRSCLSRVLEVLVQEGLSVVNCSCNKVNGRLLHSIQTEVSSPASIDAYELQQKLAATLKFIY